MLPKKSDSKNTSSANDPVRLKRRLGLWNGVAVIVGVIIGSGIFISPGGVYKDAGSVGASLCVWGICGLLSLMGALCMAELGTSIPDSGGDYSYIKMAYGDGMSFLYLWVTVLIILPASNAAAAMTFATYVTKPFFLGCLVPVQAIQLFAFAIILILTWVNCYSVKWSIRLQNSFTFLKVLALVLVMLFGFYYIVAGKSKHLTSDSIWAGEPLTFVGLATAFYSGFYSYAGWNALNFITEEIKNPIKNMPRAIIISITAITVIYVLVNTAYFAVLTSEEIVSSNAIAVTFGDKAMGPFSFVMPVSVALSTTSGLNALIFSSSRILFVGARQGQLFSFLNMISIKHLTPVPSLILVGFMSCVYLVNTDIDSMIRYLVFIEAGYGALGVSTVLVLRYRFPDIVRPIRVHTFVPVIYLIASVFLLATPIMSKPLEFAVGLSILFLGIPVYFFTAKWTVKPRVYQKSVDKLNKLTQKLTLSVPQEGELPDLVS